MRNEEEKAAIVMLAFSSALIMVLIGLCIGLYFNAEKWKHKYEEATHVLIKENQVAS